MMINSVEVVKKKSTIFAVRRKELNEDVLLSVKKGIKLFSRGDMRHFCPIIPIMRKLLRLLDEKLLITTRHHHLNDLGFDIKAYIEETNKR